MIPRFDLQSHSSCSDGSLAPAGAVARAHEAGVELLALTDHDTVAGVAEAREAARRAGIALVSAVEISVHEAGRDLHLVGYLIDEQDDRLLELLERSRTSRSRRARAMLSALRELGWELDERALGERLAGGLSVGRPHLARAAALHPANAARMRDERLADADTFLEAYLVEGAPAFRPRQSPTAAQAIEVVSAAGGLAVWAHPFDGSEHAEALTPMLDRLQRSGLDGVECFYVEHSRGQTDLLCDEAATRGLLATGSSDFHGPEHPRFSRFLAFATYGRDPVLGRIAAPSAAS
jgi:predicted metal-dependent phosphoesterase TrpH